MIPLPTIYHGAVINPQTLTSYDALPNCLLAVSPDGDVEWMVDDVDDSMVQEIMSQKGCLDAEVIDLKHGEFIIPGFIDTHTVSPHFNSGWGMQSNQMNLPTTCLACTSSS